jgi:hypothetical protein
MKFEQTINKHFRLLREAEEELPELPPGPEADPAAMGEAPPVDPAAAEAPPMEPGLGDVPEESPDVVAMKAQSLEDTRKAALINPADLTDEQRHALSAGEVTVSNIDEKEALIRDILGANPGDVTVGGLESRPGVV